MNRFVRSMLLVVGLAALTACATSPLTTETQPVEQPTPVNDQQPSLPQPAKTATRSVVVHFDSDSSEIRAAAMQILYGTAQELGQSRLLSVRVIGHTDSSGRRAYNQRLSERRATAVADQLNKLGLRADAITVSGDGEAATVSKSGKGVKAAADRKVEIIIESVEPPLLSKASASPTAPRQSLGGTHREHAAPSPPMVLPSSTMGPMTTDRSVSPSSPQLRVCDKPAIKRDLCAAGRTWLPPPAA